MWEVPVEQARVAAETGAKDPVVSGDTVFVVLNTVGTEESVDRWLVALDAASGTELWRNSL